MKEVGILIVWNISIPDLVYILLHGVGVVKDAAPTGFEVEVKTPSLLVRVQLGE